ncbi:hypothetical protein [Hymenobacter latericus]|uniref:hypothetical protein n=1 Tax=Hymenobacter sp. YIM 151858-1 TaxID=2987688 RepID=UPI0022280134|nr:hypothetical protein [Hymenobacter sp. YIM 151858-1]UYZ57622.1 hypothetical protein OIS50_11130 [Hymenobacter sp. YIM 151858-1]
MKTNLTPSYRLLLAYLLLTLCYLGAALVGEWQEYRSWSQAGSYLSLTDFAAWSMASSQQTVLLLTVPSVVLSALVLALFWYLPASVPRGPLWVVLACHVVVWAAFFLARMPLPGAFSENELANLLLHSDWVRKLALLIEVPMALYMAYRAYGANLWPARPASLLRAPGSAPAMS